MKGRLLIQETNEDLEFQHNIIQTAKKYFNCSANNFYFYNKEDFIFNLDIGICAIQIKVTPKTPFLPKRSYGYVYYGHYHWERNIKDDTFEDSCRKISEFLKEQVSKIKKGLIWK